MSRYDKFPTHPLDGMGGIDPPAQLPPRTCINVNGREEHEAIIKDAARCEELGLCQAYEIIVYLKRWGGWLSDADINDREA